MIFISFTAWSGVLSGVSLPRRARTKFFAARTRPMSMAMFPARILSSRLFQHSSGSIIGCGDCGLIISSLYSELTPLIPAAMGSPPSVSFPELPELYHERM